MPRFGLFRNVLIGLLVSSILAPTATAQRDTLFGLCHTDPATGETQYLEVPESEIRVHMAHGDRTAPNGPDDCAATGEGTLPEDEVRPTEVPPDVEDIPAPVANDDEYEAEIGVPLVVPAPGVLANDRNATSAVLVRDPSWGTLDFGRDGSFTYLADRDNPGNDVFAYQATNEEGYIDIGEVFIHVPAGVNDPPVAIDDTYQLQGAAPFVVAAPGVLSNDYDPDQDPLTLVGFGTGAKGATTPQESPDGGFTFIPVSGVEGQYPFTTIITDGLATASSTLILDVSLDPDSPVAAIDTYTAPATGTLTVAAANGLLANDSSPVGSSLTTSLYQGYPTATVTVNADGSFAVSVPGGAKPGSFMLFWYQLTDDQGRAVLQQVSITFQ